MTDVVIAKRHMPVAERCVHCQLVASPCYAAPEGKCATCEVEGTECSFIKISDAALQEAINQATREPVPPSTEVQRQTELAQLQKQRLQLDYDQKRLMVIDFCVFLRTVVEEYWKFVMFFFPILGMLAPPLFLAIGFFFCDPIAPSAERLAIEEAIKKATARQTELKNYKIPRREVSILEFVGIISLIFMGVFVFCTLSVWGSRR
jgi:hypothetical protein